MSRGQGPLGDGNETMSAPSKCEAQEACIYIACERTNAPETRCCGAPVGSSLAVEIAIAKTGRCDNEAQLNHLLKKANKNRSHFISVL